MSLYNRRTVLCEMTRLGASTAGLALLSSACMVLPNQTRRMPRIAYLGVGTRESLSDRVAGFLAGLNDLGYVESQTIAIDWRFTPPGIESQAQMLAADLVRSTPDVIVMDGNTTTAVVVRQATSTIPIVAVNVALPLETGLVSNAARPGGNLTALTSGFSGAMGKLVQLLRDVVPNVGHVAAVVDPGNPSNLLNWAEFQTAADAAGLHPQRVDVLSPDELAAAFESPAFAGAEALVVVAGGLLLAVPAQLGELALRYRVPAIGGFREFVLGGLLMSYGSDLAAISRRAAVYVDKILKGANPGDLPVEQPTTFVLAVNVPTLQALGLAIPPTVLPLVTEWIG